MNFLASELSLVKMSNERSERALSGFESKELTDASL